MPGSWAHLAGRFVDSLRARPLDDAEAERVRGLLPPALVAAWFDQPPVDQRHGLEAAYLAMAAGARSEVVTAALVHDIGKRHARLGIIGRSVVSAMAKSGLPTSARGRSYLAHDELGADELEAAGLDGVVVAFARHHHGARPEDIDAGDWRLLLHADGEVPGPEPLAG